MYAQGTRGHDILAIFLVSIAHASSHFYHLVIPSLFPWILPHFGMNFLQGGTLMTTFFVTSAVGQSMSGFLVDKVGGRTSMYTGLVLLIASAVALGMAENVPMLYLSAMLAGAGEVPRLGHRATFVSTTRPSERRGSSCHIDGRGEKV